MTFYAWLGRLLAARRLPVLLVLGALTAASLALVPWLEFNFTPQAIFADEEDGRAAFSEEIKATFAYEDTLFLILLESTSPEQDLLAPEVLGWTYEVTRAVEALPEVTQVASVANIGLPRERLDDPGALDTSPLVQQAALTPAQAAEVRRALEGSRLVDGELISRDRRVAVIAVFLSPEMREINALTEATRVVKEAVDARPLPPGVRLRYGGIPELRVYIVEGLRSDQLRILPLAALVLIVVMSLLFRRFSGVGPPLVAVGIGAAWLVAVFVALSQSLNIINNIIFVLVGIIGTADAVHLISRYGEERQRHPDDPRRALMETVQHMGLACLLTSLTTMVGFLSLVVSRTDILQAFGWQAAVGVGLAYVAVMTFLPAALPSFKPPRVLTPAGEPGWIERATVALAGPVLRWPRLTVLLGLAVMAGALWLARDVKVDSYVLETLDPEHPQSQTTRFVEEHLGGFMPIEISLKADREGAFREPDLYGRVAAFERFAAEQPDILHTRSYVDLHQELRVAFMGDPAQRDVLPTPDARGRQQIAQLQEIIDGAEGGLGMSAYMSPRFDHARVRLRIADIGTRQALQLGQRLEVRLAELFPPETGVTPVVTGEAYVASLGIDSFIRDLFYSLLMACAIIFGMVTLLFRSFRVGFISILPNIMPLVLTLGYLGVRGYDLNATNVILFSIGIGLAVDDTIHFLSRFREEMAAPDAPDVDEGIRRAFAGAGRAIVVTSVILIAGLLVLLASDFVPSQRFAELTAVTLFGALWGDLLVLPACLKLFWRPRSPP